MLKFKLILSFYVLLIVLQINGNDIIENEQPSPLELDSSENLNDSKRTQRSFLKNIFGDLFNNNDCGCNHAVPYESVSPALHQQKPLIKGLPLLKLFGKGGHGVNQGCSHNYQNDIRYPTYGGGYGGYGNYVPPLYTSHQLPKPTYYEAPKPNYEVPKPTYYEAPKPNYEVPKPSYEVPKPTYYEAPKPNYEVPKPSYETPKPSYETPKPSYEEPKPSYYESPKPSYEAPKPSYEHPKPHYDSSKPYYEEIKPSYEKPKPYYEKPKPSYEKPQPSYEEPKPSYEPSKIHYTKNECKVGEEESCKPPSQVLYQPIIYVAPAYNKHEEKTEQSEESSEEEEEEEYEVKEEKEEEEKKLKPYEAEYKKEEVKVQSVPEVPKIIHVEPSPLCYSNCGHNSNIPLLTPPHNIHQVINYNLHSPGILDVHANLPPHPPAYNHHLPVLTAHHSNSYHTQSPIPLSYADQPYRDCPELFYNYKRSIAEYNKNNKFNHY